MSIYGVHKLCRSMLHDAKAREAVKADPRKGMEAFPLTEAEKGLLLAGDVTTLWEQGASGFLLSYLTRWELFGLTVPVYCERMRKARDWRYDHEFTVSSGREGDPHHRA
jgi:hypothetical protein